MRKVVLYIAMSLDGYIADKNGDVSWLVGDGSSPETFDSYQRFIKGIDTVILGYKTYDQIVSELSPNNWPYKSMKTYVMTSKSVENKDDIVFTKESLKTLVETLKSQNGKDIWICGGATIVNELHNLNLIDEYTISIIPTILGGGIKLFQSNLDRKSLKLLSTESYNGIVEVKYSVKSS